MSVESKWAAGAGASELTPVSGEFAVPQFDLPLGWLAPGEYVAEFTASARTGSVKESVWFKLIG